MRTVKIGSVTVGKGYPVVVIAGPCVLESQAVVWQTAERLAELAAEMDFPLIFKASYDKANRTSIDSFRGPGREQGLEMLREVKQCFELPITTDIHSVEDAKLAAEVVNMIQVPALLCRQTDLLVAAGKTGIPVNVKKGQFIAPQQARNIVEKVVSTGNTSVMLTERGTFFGYDRLVNDFSAYPILSQIGCPLVFDVTHSVQTPGTGSSTGGRIGSVPILARCAAAAGYDVLFFEVHPDPAHALCDSESTVPLADLRKILEDVLPVAAASRNRI